MSRKPISEYIAEKRRADTVSGVAKRQRILGEVCETLGYTRKCVNRLLTGNIRYKEHKGRGKTYGESVSKNVRRTWETVGCPCTTHFVAELPRIVKECEECVALIRPKEDKAAILSMSASTLDRAFKGLPRIRPFAVKANRRSGLNRPILDAIECKSGEEMMACEVKPGDTQIDAVAHCGGDMRGNFFWTLTQTDRNAQWTEVTPTRNRGMHNTVEALKRLERRFPFPITSGHEDNGPESINYAMAELQGKRKGIAVSRSRLYRKNDNAHVEQKNGSVVRELFGELRLDCLDLEDDLLRLESEWSDYCNFFRPTKMTIAKTKKPDGKGHVRKCQPGGPRTPYQRVLESGVLDGTIDLRKPQPSTRQRKLKSVQHLTNQKKSRQLPGARPT